MLQVFHSFLLLLACLWADWGLRFAPRQPRVTGRVLTTADLSECVCDGV